MGIYRDICQVEDGMVWGHEVVGSSPAIPTKYTYAAIGRRGRLKSDYIRVQIPLGVLMEITQAVMGLFL